MTQNLTLDSVKREERGRGQMMLQVVDPGRAVLAAAIMAAAGIVLFLYRNRKTLKKRLRGVYE